MNLISILIPIYNVDVTVLVKELYNQLELIAVNFEIVLIDDASPNPTYDAINQKLDELDHVCYEALPQNIGRSRIRNLLVKRAQHDHLLFLDCDAAIIYKNFMLKYVQLIPNYTILCGGRVYSDQKPEDKSYLLHWLYGTNVESVNAKQRSVSTYKSFMTNNFLIKKSIFDQIQFNESVSTYGHEDTLFGMEAKQHNIPISHIDNPVLHAQLDSTLDYLAKTIDATHNLARIEPLMTTKSDVRLLKIYHLLQKTHLTSLTFFLTSTFIHIIERNLLSNTPSLRLLNIYKLYHFIKFKNNYNE